MTWKNYNVAVMLSLIFFQSGKCSPSEIDSAAWTVFSSNDADTTVYLETRPNSEATGSSLSILPQSLSSDANALFNKALKMLTERSTEFIQDEDNTGVSNFLNILEASTENVNLEQFFTAQNTRLIGMTKDAENPATRMIFSTLPYLSKTFVQMFMKNKRKTGLPVVTTHNYFSMPSTEKEFSNFTDIQFNGLFNVDSKPVPFFQEHTTKNFDSLNMETDPMLTSPLENLEYLIDNSTENGSLLLTSTNRSLRSLILSEKPKFNDAVSSTVARRSDEIISLTLNSTELPGIYNSSYSFTQRNTEDLRNLLLTKSKESLAVSENFENAKTIPRVESSNSIELLTTTNGAVNAEENLRGITSTVNPSSAFFEKWEKKQKTRNMKQTSLENIRGTTFTVIPEMFDETDRTTINDSFRSTIFKNGFPVFTRKLFNKFFSTILNINESRIKATTNSIADLMTGIDKSTVIPNKQSSMTSHMSIFNGQVQEHYKINQPTANSFDELTNFEAQHVVNLVIKWEQMISSSVLFENETFRQSVVQLWLNDSASSMGSRKANACDVVYVPPTPIFWGREIFITFLPINVASCKFPPVSHLENILTGNKEKLELSMKVIRIFTGMPTYEFKDSDNLMVDFVTNKFVQVLVVGCLASAVLTAILISFICSKCRISEAPWKRSFSLRTCHGHNDKIKSHLDELGLNLNSDEECEKSERTNQSRIPSVLNGTCPNKLRKDCWVIPIEEMQKPVRSRSMEVTRL